MNFVLHLHIRVGRLYVRMAPKCQALTNATAQNSQTQQLGHMTWSTSVSIHDNTRKDGKIHHYNDIGEIAKTPIPSNSIAQNC